MPFRTDIFKYPSALDFTIKNLGFRFRANYAKVRVVSLRSKTLISIVLVLVLVISDNNNKSNNKIICSIHNIIKYTLIR